MLVFGHAGVDFFFVLSGFIIMHVHNDDIGQPARIGNYLWRRFSRIFPFYWVITAVCVLLIILGQHADALTVQWAISSVFLLPRKQPPIVGVAWTLTSELVFYLIFALLIWNRRIGALVMGVWLTSVCLTMVVQQIPATFLSSRFHLHFFFGMATAIILRRSRVPAPAFVLSTGILAFLALGLAENLKVVSGLDTIPHIGYAVSSAIIVLGLVEVERQRMLQTNKAFVMIGSASYSIYLTHILTIGVIWQVYTRVGIPIPMWILCLIFIVGGTLGGWLIHRFVELPLMSWVRQRSPRSVDKSEGVTTPAARLS
jgi:exopolysaccharide production protein ExoZ